MNTPVHSLKRFCPQIGIPALGVPFSFVQLPSFPVHVGSQAWPDRGGTRGCFLDFFSYRGSLCSCFSQLDFHLKSMGRGLQVGNLLGGSAGHGKGRHGRSVWSAPAYAASEAAGGKAAPPDVPGGAGLPILL